MRIAFVAHTDLDSPRDGHFGAHVQFDDDGRHELLAERKDFRTERAAVEWARTQADVVVCRAPDGTMTSAGAYVPAWHPEMSRWVPVAGPHVENT